MKARVMAKPQVAVKPEVRKPIDVYCDGSGAGPDGRSAHGWLRPDTGERHVENTSGASCNESEYAAVLSAISSVPDRSFVRVFSDSQLVCNQLIGRYAVHDPDLARLHSEIYRVVMAKKLRVRLMWIPREKNLADALLRKKK